MGCFSLRGNCFPTHLCNPGSVENVSGGDELPGPPYMRSNWRAPAVCDSHRHLSEPCTLDPGGDRLGDVPCNQGVLFSVELLNTVNSVRVCLVWLLQVCMFREKSFFLLPRVALLFLGLCYAGHSSGLIRGGGFTTAFGNGTIGQVLLPVRDLMLSQPWEPSQSRDFQGWCGCSFLEMPWDLVQVRATHSWYCLSGVKAFLALRASCPWLSCCPPSNLESQELPRVELRPHSTFESSV